MPDRWTAFKMYTAGQIQSNQHQNRSNLSSCVGSCLNLSSSGTYISIDRCVAFVVGYLGYIYIFIHQYNMVEKRVITTLAHYRRTPYLKYRNLTGRLRYVHVTDGTCGHWREVWHCAGVEHCFTKFLLLLFLTLF
jgi:hypothetical protein